jgi:Protein of unknown function (DUF1549)/Protein of unknown function (DUF1553)
MAQHAAQRHRRHAVLFLLAVACAGGAVGGAAAAEPLHETIDRLVEAALIVPPAPVTGDAEFLRRVSLDLTNRIASTDDARAFLKNASPTKRQELIEALLASPQHARRLANFLDVTLMERRRDKYVSRPDWENWLYQACLDNRPWDQLVREVLAADGADPAHRAPAKFCLEREADTNLLTRDVGRVFFGRDIQCAQCHNHPNVNDYEQREYYGLFSFFQRTELVKQASGVYVLGEKVEGDAAFESVFAKGQTHAARPALPGGAAEAVSLSNAGEEYVARPADKGGPIPKNSRRELLARAATAGDNRAFNRNIVNRLWAMMMGRGLVHPVDFDHSDNPPTHPELLDRLADEFAATKYDIRGFLKELALSKTYQRSFDLPAAFDGDAAGSVGQAPAMEAAAAAAKKAVDAANAAAKAARKEALAAREQVDKPLKELRAAEAELAKLRKIWAPATVALAETRRQLQAKTDANAAVVKALELARQALGAIPADAELKIVVDKLQARSTLFGIENQALAKTIATQSDAVKQSGDKVQAAEKVVTDAAAKVQAADKEAQPVLSKYAAARRIQQQAKADLAMCERRLQTAKSLTAYRSKAEALARIQDQFGPIEREVTVARRTLRDAAGRKETNQREVTALERQCESLRQTMAAATESLKQRQQAADALALAADQVEKAGALFKDEELTRAAGAVRQRKAALAATTAGTRQQLANREAEYKAAIATGDRLHSEKPELDRTFATAAARVADLEAKHQKPLADLKVVQTQYAAARQDLLDRLSEIYAVAPLKPLTPEQLHWSVLQATGILSSYEATAEAEFNKKQPLTEVQKTDAHVRAERAIAREKDVYAKLAGNLAPFVQLFGGGPGQPQFEFFATADQALFMENSDTIRSWTAPGVTLIQRLTKQTQPAAVAEELYLSVLNRLPTPDEIADVGDCLARNHGPTPTAAGQLAWAVLASVEFRFNH